MSVLPKTQLGYTLGLKRDKNKSRGRTRMAGDRRVDIFTAERDYMRAPTVRGDFLPNRFVASVPVSRLENSDG